MLARIKDFWKQTYRFSAYSIGFHFASAFFEENLDNPYPDFLKGTSPYFPPLIALRKILNPFKWLSFLIKTILTAILFLYNIILMTPILALVESICGKGIALYLSAQFLKGLSYLLALPFHLLASLFHPVLFVQSFMHDKTRPRWQSLLILLAGLLLASFFILATVYSLGTLPAALLFLQPLVSAFSPAIAWVASGIGIIATKIFFSLAFCIMSLTALKTPFSLLLPSKKNNEVRTEMILLLKEKDEPLSNEEKKQLSPSPNIWSQVLFSAPEDSGIVKPEVLNALPWHGKLWWGTKKSFGWNPSKEQAKSLAVEKEVEFDTASTAGNIEPPPVAAF